MDRKLCNMEPDHIRVRNKGVHVYLFLKCKKCIRSITYKIIKMIENYIEQHPNHIEEQLHILFQNSIRTMCTQTIYGYIDVFSIKYK